MLCLFVSIECDYDHISVVTTAGANHWELLA